MNLMQSARPVDLEICFRRHAKTEMKPWIVAGVIAGLAYQCLRLTFAPVVGDDARPDCTSIRFDAFQLYLEPVLLYFDIVSQ